ncbi:ankyrin repeat-containing domain protein [Baffinella frigidus]|nr:ankyrin repeat-containing domain protein [Cryptophyta sp. CCMP2293]
MPTRMAKEAREAQEGVSVASTSSPSLSKPVSALVGHGGGADVGGRDGAGRSPLLIAAAAGNLAALPILLAAGAAISARDSFSGTPLAAAASNGHARCVETLLAAGADANILDRGGNSPLDLAMRKGHSAVVRVLTHPRASHAARDCDAPLAAAGREHRPAAEKPAELGGLELGADYWGEEYVSARGKLSQSTDPGLRLHF